MSGFDIRAMASAARAASQVLARATGETKNAALRAMAAGLLDSRERILAANAEDVAVARAEAHPGAFVDRLTLTPPRLDAMARGLRQIADLP
ncbi:MAG: gamma-glutamyl-phosphate reductase, partial [candidate division NC10 bacterium]|nr:gamma-glutamyl-phosphate reductase [candidate division NC10 bacterium]